MMYKSFISNLFIMLSIIILGYQAYFSISSGDPSESHHNMALMIRARDIIIFILIAFCIFIKSRIRFYIIGTVALYLILRFLFNFFSMINFAGPQYHFIENDVVGVIAAAFLISHIVAKMRTQSA